MSNYGGKKMGHFTITNSDGKVVLQGVASNWKFGELDSAMICSPDGLAARAAFQSEADNSDEQSLAE